MYSFVYTPTQAALLPERVEGLERLLAQGAEREGLEPPRACARRISSAVTPSDRNRSFQHKAGRYPDSDDPELVRVPATRRFPTVSDVQSRVHPHTLRLTRDGTPVIISGRAARGDRRQP
jgi:hypothetical protein